MNDLPTIIQAIAQANDRYQGQEVTLMEIIEAVETNYTAIQNGNDSTG